MNRYYLVKSTLALMLFTSNLPLLNQANADTSDLKIHVNPETYELLQSPHEVNQVNQKKKMVVTRPLLSIKASPVVGGGFIVTPNKSSLPQMSIHIDNNGHMKTICR